MYGNPQTIVLKLTKVIFLLLFTVQAFLPARTQSRYLLKFEITALTLQNSLNSLAKQNIFGAQKIWKYQMKEKYDFKNSNKWYGMIQSPRVGEFNREDVTKEEKMFYINILQIIIVKITVLTIMKGRSWILINLIMGYKTAFWFTDKWWNSKQATVRYEWGNLTVPIGRSDHDYHRILTK